MYAGFGFELAVGVRARDHKGGAFNSSFFTFQCIHEFGFESFVLRPPLIHSHQHLRPVLGLGSAGSGVDGENGVLGGDVFGKEFAEFGAIELHGGIGDEGADFRIGIGGLGAFFLYELKKSGGVVVGALEVFEFFDLGFKTRFFLGERFCTTIVAPKTVLCGKGLDFLNPTLFDRQVKVNLGGRRAWTSFRPGACGFRGVRVWMPWWGDSAFW